MLFLASSINIQNLWKIPEFHHFQVHKKMKGWSSKHHPKKGSERKSEGGWANLARTHSCSPTTAAAEDFVDSGGIPPSHHPSTWCVRALTSINETNLLFLLQKWPTLHLSFHFLCVYLIITFHETFDAAKVFGFSILLWFFYSETYVGSEFPSSESQHREVRIQKSGWKLFG